MKDKIEYYLDGAKQILLHVLPYKMYFSRWFRGFIPNHLREQYTYRLRVMNPQCHKEGACVQCGCTTPNVQFAPKACDACYPHLMSRWQWFSYKTDNNINSNLYTGYYGNS